MLERKEEVAKHLFLKSAAWCCFQIACSTVKCTLSIPSTFIAVFQSFLEITAGDLGSTSPNSCSITKLVLCCNTIDAAPVINTHEAVPVVSRIPVVSRLLSGDRINITQAATRDHRRSCHNVARSCITTVLPFAPLIHRRCCGSRVAAVPPSTVSANGRASRNKGVSVRIIQTSRPLSSSPTSVSSHALSTISLLRALANNF